MNSPTASTLAELKLAALPQPRTLVEVRQQVEALRHLVMELLIDLELQPTARTALKVLRQLNETQSTIDALERRI